MLPLDVLLPYGPQSITVRTRLDLCVTWCAEACRTPARPAPSTTTCWRCRGVGWWRLLKSLGCRAIENLIVAADNPHATPFLIHILVAVAEHERNMISSRTKAAWKAAKRRGVRIGNPRFEQAIPKAVEARKRLAADRNAELRNIVKATMEKAGLTQLADIANTLNLRGIKTNHGCEFTPTHIHRLLKTA